MQEVGEVFHIKLMTTTESPWSNGACERLRGNLVNKIVADKSV